MARQRKPRVNYKEEAEKLQRELEGIKQQVSSGGLPLTMSISISKITGQVAVSISPPSNPTLEGYMEELTMFSDALSVVQRQVEAQKTEIAKQMGAQEAMADHQAEESPPQNPKS